ncbi:MAG: murein biosynthesis integral membrane protein MurJ [candidate division Zixibacteria bacterium]|nr:murein biosynthesis integral membrane protein MurJ [candidate division Zixibacteria bacterium]
MTATENTITNPGATVGPATDSGAPQRLARQTQTVAVATIVSRILGVVREQVIAYYFGAGAVTDAFVAAFRIPNLLRDFLAEGALSAAFVPTFSRVLKRDGQAAAFQLLNRLLGLFVPVLALLCLLGVLFTPQIAGLMSGGVETTPGKIALLIFLARWMFPFLLLIALAAVLMGALNALGRFGVPALAPGGFNIGMIAGTILCAPWVDPPALALAWGVLAGGVLQWAVQAFSIRGMGFRNHWEWGWRDPNVRQVARLLVPALIGQAAVQINIFAITRFAWTLGDGPVAYLNFAFRILFVPLGVFAVAAATVGLSRLSERIAAGDEAGARDIFTQGFQTVLYLVIPTSVAFIILGKPICAALFQRGQFGAEATLNTARALAFYSIGLPAMAAVRVTTPIFYSHHDTRTPTWCGMASVGTNLIGMYLLTPTLNFAGLALSVAGSAIIQVGLLLIFARRRFGGLGFRRLGTHALVFSGCSIAAVWVAHAVNQSAIISFLPVSRVIGTAVVVGVASALYIGLTWIAGYRRMGSVYAARLTFWRNVK